MQNEFTNRLGMFNAAKDTLFSPQHKTVWQGKEPENFGIKVGQAVQALTDLEKFCQQQGSVITGVAQDKAREEREAMAVAFKMAGFLLDYYEDNSDATNAAKVNVTLTGLRRLRDQEAVAKMREIHDLAKGLVQNQDAQIATAAAKYGITAALLASVHKEVEEFAAIATAPQLSISQRAVLNKQARDRFNAVEAKFVSLDRLIWAFDDTPEGRALIADFQASRIIRDSGGGSSTTTNTNTTNTTPSG